MKRGVGSSRTVHRMHPTALRIKPLHGSPGFSRWDIVAQMKRGVGSSRTVHRMHPTAVYLPRFNRAAAMLPPTHAT